MTLSILIVDDEALARDRLARLVRDNLPDATISTAASVPEAEPLLTDAKPPVQLVLLDIEMPGASGLDWLAELQSSAQPPAVIMTTAWADYALPAIQQGADGYLLKPVKASELRAAMAQAQRRNRLQGGQRTRVALNQDGSGTQVSLEDILYCEANTRWVRVVTKAGEQVSDRSLKVWEAELGHALVRIHRSYLVHQDAVTTVTRVSGHAQVTLTNGEQLPVSRRHAAALRQRLSAY